MDYIYKREVNSMILKSLFEVINKKNIFGN